MNNFNPGCLIGIALPTAIGACFGTAHAAIIGATVGIALVFIATMFT